MRHTQHHAFGLLACVGLACGFVAAAQSSGNANQSQQSRQQQQPQRQGQPPAQPNSNQSQQNNQNNQTRGVQGELWQQATGSERQLLCYFSTLNGLDIASGTDDAIGEIEDVILDRFSGEIVSYVVSADDADDERLLYPGEIQGVLDEDGDLTLRTTLSSEAIRARPVFDADVFDEDDNDSVNNANDTWWNTFTSDYEQRNAARRNRDEFNERFRGGQPQQLTGRVVRIDRSATYGEDSRAIVEIETDDGQRRTVALGPTWYLARQNVLLLRGQRVTLNAVPTEGRGVAEWTATSVATDGNKPVELRQGNEFAPAWRNDTRTSRDAIQPGQNQNQNQPGQNQPGRTNDGQMPPRDPNNRPTDPRLNQQGPMNVPPGAMGGSLQHRLMLATNIVGDEVRFREDADGSIDNLVIDLANNRVVAVVIDPDDTFLGIGDTTRLVPLSVMSASARDYVYVDATKDMILKAPAAPDSIKGLMGVQSLDEAYDQRRFRAR
ncbi:MAG: PRC-barrel domain-containing protein [Planctomycetota bacterium]|nr:PRC-barrel domain-containing protein [Planctomycetota bacterium]